MTKHRSQTTHHGWLPTESGVDHSVELDAEYGDRGAGAHWDQADGWARRLKAARQGRRRISTCMGRDEIIFAPTATAIGTAGLPPINGHSASLSVDGE
jgi:hypothetical protein